MQLTSEEVQVFSRLVYDLCGIVLDDSKAYLIENRLSDVAKANDCATFSELYYKARYDGNVLLRTQIVDAITTNETLFFRDTSPFEAMQFKVLPELIDARTRAGGGGRIRIWSAACSTGQEPYSIAMVLRELLGDMPGWDIQILGTDISDTAIRQASRGCYRDFEIRRGMREMMLEKYFDVRPDGWHVRDELRAMVSFRRINLLEPFTSIGPFDIVFCRNVAIYFSPNDRKSLFTRICEAIARDGYLFVGASESLLDVGLTPQYHCRAVFYQPHRVAVTA